ncbi:hypothetical protein TALC_01485 [Thermoplasmatales archaeon BRNA1]|nr:hypothetical protein TALC_01485 [Thermoplasmatales archaeon BRNA1]
MVDNKGNAYRTRQLVIVFCVLIGLALALLAWGAAGLSALAAVGVFLIIFGGAVVAVGSTFSSKPDKFGPSEQMYRVSVGLVILLIGVVMVMTLADVSWYVYVAILIIGIAVIGLATGLINSRNITNE